MLLNSPDFINSIFGTHYTKTLLSFQLFFLICAGLTLLLAFYIIFFKKEVQPKKEQTDDLKQTLIKIKYFFTNKNFLIYLIFNFTFCITTGPIDQLSDYELSKNQYPLYLQSAISFCMIPLSFLTAIYAGCIKTPKKEFKIVIICSVIRFVNFFYKFYLV